MGARRNLPKESVLSSESRDTLLHCWECEKPFRVWVFSPELQDEILMAMFPHPLWLEREGDGAPKMSIILLFF